MRSGLAGMPLAFLGFALWRAWVSLSYAAPAFDFPLLAGGGRLLYDVFLSLTALAVAFCARRVAPLNDQRALLVFCGVSMTASAAANLAALYRPELAAVLWLPAILLAGAGSALLILAWCEAYSCLNPVRAAVYLSLSMAGGVGLTFLLQGFRDAYLQGWLLALPVLSLRWRAAHGARCRRRPPEAIGQHASALEVPRPSVHIPAGGRHVRAASGRRMAGIGGVALHTRDAHCCMRSVRLRVLLLGPLRLHRAVPQPRRHHGLRAAARAAVRVRRQRGRAHSACRRARCCSTWW